MEYVEKRDLILKYIKMYKIDDNIQITEEIVEELAEKKVEAIGDVEKEIEEQEKREILERNREARRNKLLREKEEREKLERSKEEEK